MKIDKTQILPLTRKPGAPEGLNDTAKEYFMHLTGLLFDHGQLYEVDLKSIGRLAHLYSMQDRIEKEMNNAWGSDRLQKFIVLYDKLCKNALPLETAFSFNPSARARIKEVLPAKKKAFDLTGKKQ